VNGVCFDFEGCGDEERDILMRMGLCGADVADVDCFLGETDMLR